MQNSKVEPVYSQTNSVVLRDVVNQRWLHFHHPVKILSADCIEAVTPLLEAVQQQVEQQGYYAAGFVSYEAAPAFDRSLTVKDCDHFPLAWFGLYAQPEVIELPIAAKSNSIAPVWNSSISRQGYQEAIQRIKHHIAQGDTYQVNFSFRLRAASIEPWDFFLQLVKNQETHYAAFINLENWAICSASPELFFQLNHDTLLCRPMKGTASRDLTYGRDLDRAKALRHSEKDQAENLMIVDMIRNDLGQISRIGSVQVNQLFEIEQYPTVWQMTSSIEGSTTANLAEIFQALFPCASITGAPKIRTMQIIADLEAAPRRIYTGAIGFLAPGRIAQFNVAIRTVLIDKLKQVAEYGVGGGIVWDSIETNEFEECQIKARILTQQQPQFDLLESLLLTSDKEYFLLDLHLQRLQESASYFAFALNINAVHEQLKAIAQPLPHTPHKVRLLVSKTGKIHVEAEQIIDRPAQRLQVGIAESSIDSSNLFLYHKTTHRSIYDRAKQTFPELDDVLLWNQRGELTESCFANLVVEWDGQWYTPPVQSGLLAGTLRAWLLQQKRVQERVLYLEDLPHCSRVFLVNSVRQIQAASVELSNLPDLIASIAAGDRKPLV